MDDQMNSEARRVIELTRAARTPGTEDKERVKRALALSLAGAAAAPGIADGALATTKALTSAGAGTAVKAAGLGAATSLKIALAALIAASVGAGALLLSDVTGPNKTAPTAPAPVSLPAEAVVPAPVIPEVPVAPAAPGAPVAPVSATNEVAIVDDAVAPVAGAPADPLLAEVALLHRAQQAWRSGDAARALDLAEQHAQQHPRSALALERDALRVFTMCALGRKAQARPLALDLVKRAPRSPLRTSVEESCGLR